MLRSVALNNLYRSDFPLLKTYVTKQNNGLFSGSFMSVGLSNYFKTPRIQSTFICNYRFFEIKNYYTHKSFNYHTNTLNNNIIFNKQIDGRVNCNLNYYGRNVKLSFSTETNQKNEVVKSKKKTSLIKKVFKVPLVMVKWVVYIPYRIGRGIFRVLSHSFRGFNKLAKLAARAAVLQKVTGVSGIFKSIVGGIKHTIHWCKTGSKLYAANVKVSYYILKKLIRGHPMRYHERKLLMRTMNDALKLVPFSFFIIVPFAEFLLPVVIRFFPQMLPSTFQTNNKKDEDYLQKKLMAKKELATFFQELVQERTNQILQEELDSSMRTKAEALKQFQERLLKKSDDMNPFLSANELLVFSKLFKKEFVLDKMSYQTLKVMCKLLGITPFALKSHLVLQLRHHLLKIQREDRLILWEGVESLQFEELQEACKERAMKFYNVTKEQMQQQLKQWLDLSSRREINPILLLWSRCITMTHEPMVIKETATPTDSLESTEAQEMLVDVSSSEVLEEKPEEKVGMSKIKVIQDVVEAAQVDEEQLHEREERLEELSEKVKELKEIIEKSKEEETMSNFESTDAVPSEELLSIDDDMDPTQRKKQIEPNEESSKFESLSKEELLQRHKELLSSLDVQMQISDLQYHQLTELYSYMVKISENSSPNEPIKINHNDLKLLLDSTRNDFKQIETLSAQFQKVSENLTS
uniref:LETM1-like protein, putative n=1 Tax=Theileria annulata TaxID=5874 RepID=A0A3B0NBT0_THEAN